MSFNREWDAMTKARKTVPGQAGELTSCHRVLDALGLREALKPYRSRIVGTMPLGLHTADSDIDVLVEVQDLEAFAALMERTYGDRDDFSLSRRGADAADGEAVVVRLDTAVYPVEVHAQVRPMVEQRPYRHYAMANRLLRLGGADLREQVLALKEEGQATEPAFVQVLGLDGVDASASLLALENEPDSALCDLLRTERDAAPEREAA